MKNITGFIVEVSTKDSKPVEYTYAGTLKILNPGKKFVGYFWQMTGNLGNGEWSTAHIRETSQTGSKTFEYGAEATFAIDKVTIVVRALRGPESNNRYLSEEYEDYETWHEVSSGTTLL